MLGPAGEHAVGLARGFGHQVVHHHAQVGLVAAQPPGVLPAGVPHGVDPGDQPLARGFFVARGAVDLPGQKQPGHRFHPAGRVNLMRPDHVVFNRIAGLKDDRVLAARQGVHDFFLHVQGQAGADAVAVDLVGAETFGFEEHVVAGPVGEAHDLVFDAGAVARARGVDLAVVHRRPVQVVADQRVAGFVGVGDPAADLLRHGEGRGVGEVAEGRGGLVAGLHLQALKVQAFGGQPRRGAGFQAAQIQAQLFEGGADAHRRALADAPTLGLAFTFVHERPHEGAGGQHHRVGAEVEGFAHRIDGPELAAAVRGAPAVVGAVGPTHADAHAAALAGEEFFHRACDHLQVGPGGQQALHLGGVGVLVALAARPVNGRALALIQHAELDARGIGHAAHDAAQGVDLADDLPLGQPADGRVAAHGPGFGGVHGDQGHPSRPCAAACFGQQVGRGPGRLGPRVAAADHHHVVRRRFAHAGMIGKAVAAVGRHSPQQHPRKCG